MARMITMVCDRCKAQYKPRYEDSLFTVSEIDYGELDLCPACEKDLEKWMDKGSDSE